MYILYGYCLNADLWYNTHGSLKCEVSGPSLYYVASFLKSRCYIKYGARTGTWSNINRDL